MTLVAKLRKDISEAQDRILEIQKECTHPKSAQTRKDTQFPVTVFYEDEIGGQSGTEFRKGTHCVCGLCEKAWDEYLDGRPYTSFDTEDLGRI